MADHAARRYARIAGVLLLVSLVAGGFGEFYVPSRLIVTGNAAATAANIKTFAFLFRLGFVGYLLEAMCDIALNLIFYILLRPVQKDLSLLAVFFGLIGTALFGVAELFYIAAPLILGGAGYLQSFSPAQLDTLALLSLRLYGYGGVIFTAFYGVAWVLRGYLIFRSGYLPKLLGALAAVGGAGFVIRNFALVLAPGYAPGGLLLPMIAATLALTFWLLVKGVDPSRWNPQS